jgi:hypothetical protein
MAAPKPLDPTLPLFTAQAPAALPPRQWADVAAEIERHTSWQVQQVAQQHSRVVVRAQTDNPVHLQARIDRVVAIMHALAPQELAWFELHLHHQGLPLSQVHVNRAEWVLQRSQPLTRDGGARLQRRVQLFDLTQARSPGALSRQPAP